MTARAWADDILEKWAIPVLVVVIIICAAMIAVDRDRDRTHTVRVSVAERQGCLNVRKIARTPADSITAMQYCADLGIVVVIDSVKRKR